VVHPGAIYLHQGEYWLVTELDGEASEAYATAASGEYDTIPVTESDITIRTDLEAHPVGRGEVHRGVVDVQTRVVAFLRRNVETGRIMERVALDMPARTLRTQAVWFTLPPVSRRTSRVRAGAHGAEHVLVSLLASVAGSDRSDVSGGFSARHPDTDAVTVFIYDTAPGGAGFAEAGYDRADTWLAIALDRVVNCSCEAGCPRCCITPGCPVANDDVDKASALALLTAWAELPNVDARDIRALEERPAP
jgi:DEAD/DEAH box helicase domain-containing protein